MYEHTERPMLMQPEMAASTLAETKTETRRTTGLDLFNEAPDDFEFGRTETGYKDGRTRYLMNLHGSNSPFEIKCPYGEVGDCLWIKETHFLFGSWIKAEEVTATGRASYEFLRHTNEIRYHENPPSQICKGNTEVGWYKRPSMFMFRKDSRILLELKEIFPERLKDITDESARNEGVTWDASRILLPGASVKVAVGGPRSSFTKLWDKINGVKGPNSWDANPWVWVLRYKKL